MARRGAMTAIQAALAGLSGGAAGYVRQKEMQREQDRLKKQEERQGLLDALSLFEKGALEVGPLATRVPPGASLGEGPRPPMAASGEAVRAPRPSMGAIPLAGVGQEAMQQAEAGLSRYETGGPGALSFEIGGRRMALPSAATRQAEAAQDELSAAVRQAEATGAVRMRQERQLREETLTEDNRSAYNELVAMGLERGPFQSGRRYTDRLANELEMRKIAAQDRITPYQQAQLDMARRQLELREAEEKRRANAPAAQTVGTGDKAFSRADVDFLMQFAPVAQQRDGRTVYQEPASSLNTFGVKFAQYDISNWAVGENEQRYAAVAGAIADAKARASEKGVLTNQDIDRYRRSIIIRPGDSVATKADKFRRMQTWANDLLGTSAPAGLPNNPGEY